MVGDVDNTDAAPDALRHLTEEQTERLSAVLDDYLARLEAGEAPDREALLSANSDIRLSLELYLGKLGELHNFAAGFSPHLAGTDDLGETAARTDSFTEVEQTDGGDTLHDSDPLVPLVTTADTAAVSTKVLNGDFGADDNPVGRKLDDFQLLRVIGRGGMGIVYEAEQTSLKRRVALKLLPLISVLDARQITRFKNEAQAAASLQHPHIVPVYAVGNYRGVHYYAMRFIDGYPLDAIIAALKHQQQSGVKASDEAVGQASAVDLAPIAEGGWTVPPAYQRVVKLGIQAATALAAAHEEGIIHRDIKPSNLMIDKKNKLWITDFGLARRASDHSLTATGDVVGTLRYMSPEQARGHAVLVDGRSDVYSLGTTLYELLALQPAIDGESSPALLRAIDSHKPISLRQLRPDLPRDLVTVIEKAMSKAREDRYLTAQELADDLTRVLDGRPTLAKPPSLLMRGVKWVQRNQRAARLAAFLGLTTAMFLTVALWTVISSRIESANDRRESAARLQTIEIAKQQVLGFEKVAARIPGTAGLRTDMIAAVLKLYEDLASQQRDQAPKSIELVTALIEMGQLYSKSRQFEEAQRTLNEAQQVARALIVDRPGDIGPRRELARATDCLGYIAQGQQDFRTALSLAEQAVRLQTELTQLHPQQDQLQIDLARYCNNLSLLQIKLGESQRAEENLRRVLDRGDEALPRLGQADQLQMKHILAAACTNLAHLTERKQLDTAIACLQKALRYNEEVFQQAHNVVAQIDLAVNHSNLGKALSDAQRYEEAARQHLKAVEISQLLVKVEPSNTDFVSTLAGNLNNLGMAELKLSLRDSQVSPRNVDSPLRHLTEAVSMQKRLVERDPADALLHHELGGMYNNLASAQEIGGQDDGVEASYVSAIEHQRQAMAAAPEMPDYRSFLDTHLLNYRNWLLTQARFEAAMAVVQERHDLWPAGDPHQLKIATDLAKKALELAQKNAPESIVSQLAQSAIETLSLAREAGLSVQSILAEEPFASLANLKSLTKRARP